MCVKKVTSFCLFHVFICAINRNEYHLRIGKLETGQTVDIQSTVASMRMRPHIRLMIALKSSKRHSRLTKKISISMSMCVR